MGGLSLHTPFPAGWLGGHPALSHPCPAFAGPLRVPVGFLPHPLPPLPAISAFRPPAPRTAKASWCGASPTSGVGVPQHRALISWVYKADWPYVCGRNTKLQPSCVCVSLSSPTWGRALGLVFASRAVLVGEAEGPSPSIWAVPLQPPLSYRSFPRTEPLKWGRASWALGPQPGTHWPCGCRPVTSPTGATFSLTSGRAVGSIPEHASEGSERGGPGQQGPLHLPETLPGCRQLLASWLTPIKS